MRIIKEGYTNLLQEKEYLEFRIKILEDYERKIEEELVSLKKLLEKNIEITNKITETICGLTGIENNLYKSIVIEGFSATKAVDRASFTFHLDPSTIWKNYYPNVKKLIQELSSSSDYPVTSR